MAYINNRLPFTILTSLIIINFISCENNSIKPQQESKECPILADCVEDGCTYCDICGDTLVTKGTTLVYEAITRNIDNVCFEWTIINGNMSIEGSNKNSIVVLKINNDFTNGILKMSAQESCSDSLIVCSTLLEIKSI